MLKDRVLALAGGVASALFYLAVVGGSPGAIAVALLAQLPLFLVGLSLGTIATVIAAGAATAVIAVVAGGDPAVEFALKTALPVLILVRLALITRTAKNSALQWYPPGQIVGWLCAAGLVTVGILMFSGPPTGLGEGAKDVLAQTMENMGFPASEAQIERLVRIMRLYYAGTFSALMLLLLLVNAALGQWMATQFGRNIRPTPAYSTLVLPIWVDVALLASAALSFLPSQTGILAQNAFILLSAPFFFVGLAVIHNASIGWPGRTAFLAMLYFLVFLLVWPAIMIVGLGILEPVVGLRQRFASRGPDREKE